MGEIVFPNGVCGPGRFAFQYFSGDSHIPLAVSKTFVVACPEVSIASPDQIEIGRPFTFVLRVTNYDFDAARQQGLELPRMYERDFVGFYPVDDDENCCCQVSVPIWTEKSDLVIEDLSLTSPGVFIVKYIVGSLANHVAGTCRCNPTLHQTPLQSPISTRFRRTPIAISHYSRELPL